MKPLFVSYTGTLKKVPSKGWVVLTNHPPLATSADMTALVQYLETERGYDPESMIILNFQRLEDAAP